MNYYAMGANDGLRRLGLIKVAIPARLPTAALPNTQRAQKLRSLLSKAEEIPQGFGSIPQETPGLFSAFEAMPQKGFNPKMTMRGVPTGSFELPAIRRLPTE